jgi:hypothetical protein
MRATCLRVYSFSGRLFPVEIDLPGNQAVTIAFGVVAAGIEVICTSITPSPSDHDLELRRLTHVVEPFFVVRSGVVLTRYIQLKPSFSILPGSVIAVLPDYLARSLLGPPGFVQDARDLWI